MIALALRLLPRAFKAAPYIVAGLLLAALVVQHRYLVVTRERVRVVTVERDRAVASLVETVVEPDRRGKRPKLVVAEAERAAAKYRQARVQAALTATTAARSRERRDIIVTQEVQNALVPRIAAARAASRAHADRLCQVAPADRGATLAPGDLSRAADTARDPDRTGQATVVAADLAACGEAVIKAEGWREWWARVAAPLPVIPQP